MKNNDIRRPLSPEDSENKTLGCRYKNFDICKNNSTPGKCAFVRSDNMCLIPPRTWRKLYQELLEKKKQ